MELPKMAGTEESHLSHAQIQQQKQYCIMALIGVFVFLSVHFNNCAVAVTAAALAFGYIAMESWYDNKRELHLISTNKECMAQLGEKAVEIQKMKCEQERMKCEQEKYKVEMHKDQCNKEVEIERARCKRHERRTWKSRDNGEVTKILVSSQGSGF